MKKIALILLICVIAPAMLLAQTGTGNPLISIQKGKLSLNGKAINKPWQLESLKSGLDGKDDVKPGFNMVHTYNEMGILLFEAKVADSVGSGNVSEIQIFFSAVPDEEGPREYFKGTARLDNVAIQPGLSLAALRKKLTALKYTESKSYLDHSYRFAKAGIYIYFRYDATDEQLLRISFGEDKPF